jgi:Domain of unknown function (DUF4105)
MNAMKKPHKLRKSIWAGLGLLLAVFFVWQGLKKPALQGDWQVQLSVPSTAEFHGDVATVHNVRNFRYFPTENDTHPAYYDRDYDLTQIKRVWFIAEPFSELKQAAHTFLSFEFESGDFLAISIEARKTKSQTYSILKGVLRTYPLMYVAADERDVLLVRTNLRKDDVYVYPVKLSNPDSARRLMTDMLERMNDILVHPVWYNTLWSNCTSNIAYHVNRLDPGRISLWSWQLFATGSADELALQHGLLDTNLPIDQARKKYSVTDRAQKVGDVPGYSELIRQFPSDQPAL